MRNTGGSGHAPEITEHPRHFDCQCPLAALPNSLVEYYHVLLTFVSNHVYTGASFIFLSLSAFEILSRAPPVSALCGYQDFVFSVFFDYYIYSFSLFTL